MKDKEELIKKVSSLENVNTRLRLMNSQAKEVVEGATKKGAEKNEEHLHKKDDAQSLVKCKFKDRGACRSKGQCQYFHPTRSCQSHSKLGSCSNPQT